MSGTSTEDALARAILAGLLPQAFPFRREVEFAGATVPSLERIGFYDSWWPGDHAACFLVASLPSGGIAGALAAAALKQLLRAALDQAPDPHEALSSCRHLLASGTNVAVAILDLETGVARTASLGDGAFGGTREPGAGDRSVLAPGTHLWIAAGPATLEKMADLDAALSVSEIVATAGSGLRKGAAVGLIRFKGPGGRSPNDRSETIAITNENGRIAEAIERMERFRERHRIDEAAFAGLDLAVDEILTNLVSYAFRDGERHRIEIALDLAGGRFSIEIRDDGIAFNPLDIPPPKLDGELVERDVGGLGMHFVRNIADEITYRREAKWNILRLSKDIGGS